MTSGPDARQHYELALATKSRSGGQWDIWEAVYTPVGDDGYHVASGTG
jgi:hypothetical protein